MPLERMESTAPDPLAFLARWADVVEAALSGQTADGSNRLVAEAACAPRAQVFQSLTPTSQPSPPTLTAPARFTDRVAVNVFDTTGGRSVAAVILFATPDNKVDSDGSLVFAVRAAGLMSAGVGVVIVDVLPGLPAWATHLHSLTGVYPITRRPRNGEAPVVVVHPEIQAGAEQYAVWHHLVAAGFPLPTVAVPVRGATHLKLDLEATYLDACQRSRTPE